MRLHKRSERKNACCRIASGIPDDSCRPHLIAVEFGKPVGALRMSVNMLHVIPFLVDGGICKAIVCTEINDAYRQI